MTIWKDGKYLDLWSVVHFLSGFLLAGACFLLGFDLFWSMSLSAVALIVWELFELRVNIIEPSLNVVMDILVGFIGTSIGVHLYFVSAVAFSIPFFLIVLGVTCILSFWGFTGYLKRDDK